MNKVAAMFKDPINNSEIVVTDPHLKYLLKRVVLAHEGFLVSQSYAQAQIETRLRYEGLSQQRFYAGAFHDAINELYLLSEDMAYSTLWEEQ